VDAPTVRYPKTTDGDYLAHQKPSEVIVSSTVKDPTAGSDLVFEDAGEHELKGVPDRRHLYRVVG
jgi:hypothetical protein